MSAQEILTLIGELRLSPSMVESLICTDLDGIMAAGPTRAALMRRGLVINRYGRFGHLTEDGRKIAMKLRASQDQR